MTANIILLNITCVSFFLLAFIAFFNPLKVNVIANKWFGIFLFSAGSAVLDIIIYEAKAIDSYRQLIAFNELSRFAMMPALYLSVLHYTSVDKVLRKTEYLHFLPFLIFFVCTASFVFKAGGLIFNPDVFPAFFKMALEIFIKLAIPAQLVVYWLLSYYKLRRHQKNIQLVTSNTDPVSLNWLGLLLFGVLFMIMISIADRLSGNQFLKSFSPLGYLTGTLFLAYFLLTQKEIYPYEATELEGISTIINPGQKAAATKPRFSEDTLILLKTRVVNLMGNERLFLDNELGLPELAKEMAISPHDLSYLLNEGFGVNFFQFINSYRVNEAKQLMLSDKYRHLNILGIAYNAGFNSKTTFNTAFKKETGLSPSQFIQQAKNSATSVPSLQ
jgi:AraC-like DNA-binding protein